MKRPFKRTVCYLSRCGLCVLISLLLLLFQLPVASAALSETELSLITGAGLPGESVVAEEISAGEEVEAVILPQDEPILPLTDTAEQPPAAEATSSEESTLIAEAGQLKDGAEIPEISVAEVEPPAAEATAPVPGPAGELSPNGAKESVETIKPVAEGMVLQSTAYSCGPAALATLLKMTGGQIYYDQIMQMVTLDERGSNMLDLRRAATALGYQAQGWRLALPDLVGAGPLLSHVVLNGEHHFTVVLSVDEHFAYLADPTLGRIAMPLEEFTQAFSGAVLKVSPAAVIEVPAADQDPAAEDPLISQPAAEPVAEPVEDVLPNQPIAEAPAVEADTASEVSTAEDSLISQPAVEPVEDALPEQPVAQPVPDAELDQARAEPVEDALPDQPAAEAPAEYTAYGQTDTSSAAEETSFALVVGKANSYSSAYAESPVSLPTLEMLPKEVQQEKTCELSKNLPLNRDAHAWLAEGTTVQLDIVFTLETVPAENVPTQEVQGISSTQEAAIQFITDTCAASIPENTSTAQEIQPNTATIALIDDSDMKKIRGRCFLLALAIAKFTIKVAPIILPSAVRVINNPRTQHTVLQMKNTGRHLVQIGVDRWGKHVGFGANKINPATARWHIYQNNPWRINPRR